MSNYYSRYKSGECEAVYRELLSLGGAINERSIYPDAQGIASEIVDRSFRNLQLIKNRLETIGYIFLNPNNSLTLAENANISYLNDIENKLGKLPLVAKAWYERFESVDFTQHETQIFIKNGSNCCYTSGLGWNTPLVFFSLPKCIQLQSKLIADEAAIGGDPDALIHFLPTGAWASNSNAKGFLLPNSSFDATLYDDGEGGVNFVEELRFAFEWGGFPYWKSLITNGKARYPLNCIPDYKSILPILTDGLLPI